MVPGMAFRAVIHDLQQIAQRLTLFVNLWRPTGVATNCDFQRSESAKRVNVFENRCKPYRS